MNSTKKELAKRMKVKQTITAMNKQIQKLEEQKARYIEAGKEAKQKGLTAQYELALTALRTTMMQIKRISEMKLNFEITSQMKDMAAMTTEFLQGMGDLSRDMMKLTNEKQFRRVREQFGEAMMGMEMQTEQMEEFMDDTEASFASGAPTSADDRAELEGLLSNSAADAESTDAMIEKELEALKKKMAE